MYYQKKSGKSFLILSPGDKSPKSGNFPYPILVGYERYLHLKYTHGYS